MIRPAFFGLAIIAACGGRVTSESDASTTDGASDASGASEAGSQSDDAASGTVVTCGPNTCHGSEICCNEKCGVCAFPDECVVHDCGGP